MRGYDSAPRSRAYAATMRWAAELTRIYGDGLFSELLAKAGVNAPEYADGGFIGVTQDAETFYSTLAHFLLSPKS